MRVWRTAEQSIDVVRANAPSGVRTAAREGAVWAWVVREGERRGGGGRERRGGIFSRARVENGRGRRT